MRFQSMVVGLAAAVLLGGCTAADVGGSSTSQAVSSMASTSSAVATSSTASISSLPVMPSSSAAIDASSQESSSAAASHSSIAAPPGVTPPPGEGWEYCSAANQTCNFDGTQELAFGINRAWNYHQYTETASCSWRVLGDPLPGVSKHCWVRSLSGATLYVQQCQFCHGDEGQGPNPLHLERHDRASMRAAVELTMPVQDASLCDASCADKVTDYIFNTFTADEPPIHCGAEAEADIGNTRFRRLTNHEYNKSVRALTGMTESDFLSVTRAIESEGFVGAGGALTDSNELYAYIQAAQLLAEGGVDSAPDLNGVNVDDASQVRQFIVNFGLKAFRRPLADDEVNTYAALYASAGDAREGVQWVIKAMTASPHFIYHIEKGEPTVSANGLYALTQYERANRLAYFLTGRYPDAQLFAAAQNGELVTQAQVRAQARRLVNTWNGEDIIARFVLQWLGVATVDPTLDERLKAFAPESTRTAEFLSGSLAATVKAYLANDATLGAMLTADTHYVNKDLATAWGLSPVPANNWTWEPFSVGHEKRAGLLAHPAVMAIHSSEEFASATLRGAMVYEDLLCRPELTLPADADALFPTIRTPLATNRQTLHELHAESALCAGCHNVLDPLGFGFENFAANGRFVTHETHAPHAATVVDASGITEIDGNRYSYQDARGYAEAIGYSQELQRCFNRKVFRYATFRHETDGDACSLQHVDNTLPSSNASVKDVFVELTTTDAFLYINGVSHQ